MDSLDEKLDQYKLPIALSLVGLVLIIGGLFSSGLIKFGSTPKIYPKESIVKSEFIKEIKVDISGAVLNPGVYSLASSARVEDVIKKAGGFIASSSAEYISKHLNLSQKLSDGQKIYIPFEGEPSDFAQGKGVRGVGVVGMVREKVGVNSASQPELETLPGVGPATASKIILSRPYQDLSELTSKKSVSKSVFNKIKDLVDLN